MYVFQLEKSLKNWCLHLKSKSGVSQCVGAIDGCHIPIAAPANSCTDYYNRKGWYSMILQGVVDHSYCFIDVNVDGQAVYMMFVCFHIHLFIRRLLKAPCYLTHQ